MGLDEAIELARERPLIIPRGSSSISRMAAVLTDGTSHFTGENGYKTHPLVYYFSLDENRVCLHAEADAMFKALRYFQKISGKPRSCVSFNLQDFSLSIARVLADGTTALARPCLDCQKILNHLNIKDVTWSLPPPLL